jgi:hypothetical protein
MIRSIVAQAPIGSSHRQAIRHRNLNVAEQSEVMRIRR